MQTPSLVTIEELLDLINIWLFTHTVAESPGFRCRVCGNLIIRRPVAFSIHNLTIGGRCSGFGEVEVFSIPFCRHCEPIPDASGCLHVPYELRSVVA